MGFVYKNNVLPVFSGRIIGDFAQAAILILEEISYIKTWKLTKGVDFQVSIYKNALPQTLKWELLLSGLKGHIAYVPGAFMLILILKLI